MLHDARRHLIRHRVIGLGSGSILKYSREIRRASEAGDYGGDRERVDSVALLPEVVRRDGQPRIRIAMRHQNVCGLQNERLRSDEHKSELQSLMRISYAV